MSRKLYPKWPHEPAGFQWCDELAPQDPQQRRPLTFAELRRLQNLGFPEVARRLAAGTCPDCRLNKLSRGHRDLCVKPDVYAPLPAEESPRQPWEPRASTRAA